MKCITGARFNMKATVLNRIEEVDTSNVSKEQTGYYENAQDPDTGFMYKKWVTTTPPPARPNGMTRDVNAFDIDCIARGFTDLGFRSSANSESFYDGIYKATEVIQMTFPAHFVLNRNQLVTNIRNRAGQIVWLEEETGNATVFEVQGITPGLDPFGRHVDNTAVLKRSEIQ